MKRVFSREFYIPKDAGAIKIKSKNSSAVAYIYGKASGAPLAIGFYGNASKPAFHHSFKSVERRAGFLAEWFAKMDAFAKYKANNAAEKKAKMAAPIKLAVGDILKGSWGYEQTNVDYYEVVGLKGKRSVVIRAISRDYSAGGHDAGYSVPIPGHFVGEPIVKMVGPSGDSVKSPMHGYLWKVEPKIIAGMKMFDPAYESSYH